MKYWLALLLMFFIKSSAIGDTVLDTIFQDGKDAYINGNFEKALNDFERIDKSGFLSGEIYFNIGNCYYKLGHIGNAISSYEKALRLNKRSAEIRSNLEFAKSLLQDKFEEEPASLFLFPFRWTESLVNQWEACAICVLLAWLLMLASTIYLVYPARFSSIRFLLSILGIFQIFFLVVCYDIYNDQARVLKGILVNSEIQVRSGPSESFPVGLTLHEGSKISILSQQGKWSKVALPNGVVGWLQSNSYEMI